MTQFLKKIFCPFFIRQKQLTQIISQLNETKDLPCMITSLLMKNSTDKIYRKHLKKVRYLQWMKEDGERIIWEFDEKYKIKNVTKNSEKPPAIKLGSQFISSTETSFDEQPQSCSYVPALQFPKELPISVTSNRGFIEFPLGVSYLLRHSNDPFANPIRI